MSTKEGDKPVLGDEAWSGWRLVYSTWQTYAQQRLVAFALARFVVSALNLMTVYSLHASKVLLHLEDPRPRLAAPRARRKLALQRRRRGRRRRRRGCHCWLLLCLLRLRLRLPRTRI